MLAHRLALTLATLALAGLSAALLAVGTRDVQATALLGLSVALPILVALAYTARPKRAKTRLERIRTRKTYTIRNYHLAQ